MNKRPLYFQYISPQEDREITKMLQSMLGSDTKTVASRIGCDYQDMLNRVTNQPRSPRKLELILRILECVENPEPFIRWFNLRYGYLPPIQNRKINPTAETAQDQLIETVNELGDVSREFSRAYADRKVDPREADSIIHEGYDLVQSVLEFIEILRQIKESAAGGVNGTT